MSAAEGTPTSGEDLPLQDVIWRLQVPHDSFGVFEWVSGSLWLDASDDELHGLLDGRERDDSSEDVGLLATVNHEKFHFCQVIMTGYLHHYVRELVEATRDTWNEVLAAERPRSWAETVALVDRLPSVVRPAGWGRIGRLSRHIRSTDPDDISILRIVEGHATFFEYASAYPSARNAAGFLELLSQHDVEPDYRIAFDVARARLGDAEAFRWFSLICFTSLCSTQPPDSFRRLVAFFATQGEIPAGMVPRQEDLAARCAYMYLGSPVQTHRQVLPTGVAAYDHSLEAMREHYDRADRPLLNLAELFDSRDDWLVRFLLLANPPIVLSPKEEGGFPVLNLPPEHRADFQQDLIRGAVYHRLLDGGAVPTECFRAAESEQRAELLSDMREQEGPRRLHLMTNLGLRDYDDGHVPGAMAWWTAAAFRYHASANHALAILFEEWGRHAQARELHERADALYMGREPTLPWTYGDPFVISQEPGFQEDDPDAAFECLRVAAYAGLHPEALLLFGQSVLHDDPVEGLAFLLEARGSGDQEVTAAANRIIDESAAVWGRWRSRQLLAKAKRLLVRVD